LTDFINLFSTRVIKSTAEASIPVTLAGSVNTGPEIGGLAGRTGGAGARLVLR
jgi:hypothetical protein